MLHHLHVGQGEPILFVHGFPLDHSMWRHQIEALSLSHQLIVPDLPGFGQSPSDHQSLSILGMVEDLVRLLDALKIDQVTFCGLSMGGYVGWQFWRSHPDRLSRLIACNTRAAADSEKAAEGRRSSAERVRSEGNQKFVEEMIPKLFAPANLEQQSLEVSATREVMLNTKPETIAQALLAMAARPDATPWLSEIRIPVLFIAGAEDAITPPDEMKANADLVEGSGFVELPNAGHLSPIENPVEFNFAVADFVA